MNVLSVPCLHATCGVRPPSAAALRLLQHAGSTPLARHKRSMLCSYTAFIYSPSGCCACDWLVRAGRRMRPEPSPRQSAEGFAAHRAQVRLGGARGGALDRRRHRARAVVRRSLPRGRARRRVARGGQRRCRNARRARRRAAGRAWRRRRAARAPVPGLGPASILRGAARPVDGERRRCAARGACP